jgi:acetylornithine deacetylase
VDRYLHDVAARLIACDTVSHRTNEPATQLLADELDRLGFAVALQATGASGERKVNLVARLGPPEPDGLILSGHLDVVPFEGQPGWTRDPLALGAEGDRLYGRGTCDMKGFIAQCLAAARRIEPASLERPLVFVFTCDEEIGCLGAERLAPALASLLGEVPMPRLCWIGEPTDWRIAYAHKGIVQLDLVAHGRGGHSSVPEAGVNAIALAARAIAEIGAIQEAERTRADERWRATFPDAPYATFNFGTIAGGTAANVIAEACRLRISYRPLPDGDPLAPHARIAARLAALEPRDFGSPDLRGAFELLPPRVVPGLASPRGTELEKTLRAVIGDHEPGGAPFCTDGGRLAAAGIASLICGPGELSQAHQPDESLPRAAFERGPDLVLDVLHRMLGARRRD